MQSFIQPKILAKIKNLPLIAETVAEGFLHGHQLSVQRGIGIEFNQYRGYQVGDPLSRVDWKLFARSDRYYIREAERESEIDIWFLLDCSRSMLQSSQKNGKETEWNKLFYGQSLIASLGYLAQKQGDSFAYMSLASQYESLLTSAFLPIGNNQTHWRKLLLALTRTKQGAFFPTVSLLQQQISQLQKPALIFLISDFNQKNNEINNFLNQLNTSRCEIVAIQLICDSELNFDYQGNIRFQDLESGEQVVASSEKIKDTYLKHYQQYQDKLEKSLSTKNISISRFNIDEPLDDALLDYLKRRNKIAR